MGQKRKKGMEMYRFTMRRESRKEHTVEQGKD